MMVMGFDDAPEGHSEVIYDNVRVPLGNLVLGWGRGFEVSYYAGLHSRPFLVPEVDHSRPPRTWADTPLHEIDRCGPNGTGRNDTAGNRPVPKNLREVPLRTR